MSASSSSATTRSVSLIITTYNWKEALTVVLKSVNRQTRLPDEVIVATVHFSIRIANAMIGIMQGGK